MQQHPPIPPSPRPTEVSSVLRSPQRGTEPSHREDTPGTGEPRYPEVLRFRWQPLLAVRAALSVVFFLATLASGGSSTPAEAQLLAPETETVARQRMIEDQLRRRGISDPKVLEAMETVPRHLFVGQGQRNLAYEDGPLPIGSGQTISQPYIVALMTELLEPQRADKVLEIGTGSGYQAAVLSRVTKEVYSIEIVETLGAQAKKRLRSLGYNNIRVRIGDGFHGWPEEAPFDSIILTAAPPALPEPLLKQLKVGGKLVAPVGDGVQDLVLITRTEEGFDRRSVVPVRFVPMTGLARAE